MIADPLYVEEDEGALAHRVVASSPQKGRLVMEREWLLLLIAVVAVISIYLLARPSTEHRDARRRNPRS